MKYIFIFSLIIIFSLLFVYISTQNNIIINILSAKQKQIPNSILHRNDIAVLLEKEKFESAIEVGVQSGGYADALLNRWNSCRIYVMVDPWLQQKFYDDYANVPNTEQNKIFSNAMNVVTKYSNRVDFVILKTTSDKAIPYLKGKLYDFVYLDARHDYLSVKNDINWYYPLIKPGGIIAGHDYLDSPKVAGNEWLLDSNGKKNSDYKATKSAVDEFAFDNKLNVVLTSDHLNNKYELNTWMIRKPN